MELFLKLDFGAIMVSFSYPSIKIIPDKQRELKEVTEQNPTYKYDELGQFVQFEPQVLPMEVRQITILDTSHQHHGIFGSTRIITGNQLTRLNKLIEDYQDKNRVEFTAQEVAVEHIEMTLDF